MTLRGEEALAFLASLSPSTIRLGLGPMQAALAALGHPERSVPALHVAGTNGKGSTCAFAEACLRAGGYRVGLYTSPHLERVNERIKVGGQDIADAQLAARIGEVLERCPAAAELTYFEFGTLLAFWHFAREQVDIAVLEVGLGGRLDATNLAVPCVTAVAPVSFDHMEFLGNTLREIALEKAGIFKAGVPAVIGPQPPEAARALQERVEALGLPCTWWGRDFSLTREGEEGTWAYAGRRGRLPGLRLSLRGEHQGQNAALALGALDALGEAGFPLPEAALREGLASTRWPGRMEERHLRGRTVVLDGAHNVAGVAALVNALGREYPGARPHLVFGAVADKDVRAMLEALVPRCRSVHLAPLETPRSLAPEALLEEVRRYGADAWVYASVAAALEGALEAAGDGAPVLCAGSLFLIGAARRHPS